MAHPYRVIAQSRTTMERIAWVVQAETGLEAIRAVSAELHEAGYYPTQADRLRASQPEPGKIRSSKP